MLGARSVRRDKGQVDIRGHGARQLALGLFRRFLEPLQRHGVFAQIDALFLEELLGQPVDHALVEVVAAEVGVAVGAEHFEAILGNGQDRDVKGAAAQVVHGYLLVFLLLEAIGQGGRGGLVDDAQHFEAGDPSGVLSRLAL